MKEFLMAHLSTRFEKISAKVKGATDELRAASQRASDQLVADAASPRVKERFDAHEATADAAEAYALDAIDFALAAVDEAKYATLDALYARANADALHT
jgi:hypothetical protein